MPPKKKKKKKKGGSRHSKTLDRPPASDPNPTATSPSTSATTGGGATASLPPSSALPCAPATTATVPLPPAPPLPSSLLPTFVSLINAAQSPPPAPPLPLPLPLPQSSIETHQERFSGTTADSAVPSTAPSASAASASTQSLLPITEDFLSLFIPALISSLEAVPRAKERDPEELKQMIVGMIASHLGPMESVLEILWELADKKEGAEKELKAASDALANMERLKGAVEEVAKLLAEKRKRAEISDSCGGSEREGGGPDSGSGGGDGEGGGVCV